MNTPPAPRPPTPPPPLGLILCRPRKDSSNRRLAAALQALAPAALQFTEIGIGDLPLMNQDHEGDLAPPVAAFKQALEACEAVLIVTPEYNRSVPGPLKNALDWASRPRGRNSLAGKPAAICGTSPGQIGTAAMQQHLRNVLSVLNVQVMSAPELYLQFTPELIGADGTVAADGTRKVLQAYIDAVAAWVERLSSR